MAEFDSVQVILTNASGALVVPDVTVRWRGKQDFRMDNAPLDSPVALTPSQPFSMGPSTLESNGKFRVATLQFDQSAISSWQTPAFDACLVLTQAMIVTGVSTKPLTINLSSTVASQQVVTVAARVSVTITETILSVVGTFVLFLKRKFGKHAQAHEGRAHEISTSPR